MNGAKEHLWSHLTDGAWHDDCRFCARRRRHGGTGTEPILGCGRARRQEPHGAHVYQIHSDDDTLIDFACLGYHTVPPR